MFGGSKLPQETITNELWAFNLTNQTWTRLFQDPEGETPALMNSSSTMNTTVDQNNSSTMNATMEPSDNVTMTPANQVSYLPLPVRGHTAHVVGSSMLVLFGQSSREGGHVFFVQEYDLGEWRVGAALPSVLPVCSGAGLGIFQRVLGACSCADLALFSVGPGNSPRGSGGPVAAWT